MSVPSPNVPPELPAIRNTSLSEIPYWKRVLAQAKNKAKEHAGVKTIASIAAGAVVAWFKTGGVYAAGLYGLLTFALLMAAVFVIHLFLAPRDLDTSSHQRIASLTEAIAELTKNKVVFDVSTMIRNSTVVLTDSGDAEDLRHATVFHLEAKLIIRFYNNDPEAVRVYGFRLAIVNDTIGQEWPLTLHIMPPNFRRPDAQENEYFQGLVVAAKELTGWYFFQYWMDVPKECALSLDKNCYLRVRMDAGKQDSYFVDLVVPWKGARLREVQVHNRNPEAEINCL